MILEKLPLYYVGLLFFLCLFSRVLLPAKDIFFPHCCYPGTSLHPFDQRKLLALLMLHVPKNNIDRKNPHSTEQLTDRSQ
jgi:hypothetical protein